MIELKAVDIRRAAMDLLARREHSLQELQDKLLRRFSRRYTAKQNDFFVTAADTDYSEHSPSDDWAGLSEFIEQQLTQLVNENLQSDERFVESFINGKKAKGHGPQRIRRELSQKQVSGELIEAYMDERDEQWYELARKVYLKKFGANKPRDYQEKAKRLRFMQQRGFSPYMVESLFLGE